LDILILLGSIRSKRSSRWFNGFVADSRIGAQLGLYNNDVFQL
jgi:hypothetical protein